MALAYRDSDVDPGLFSRILSSGKKSLGIALDLVHSRILLGFTPKNCYPRENPRKVESCDTVGLLLVAGMHSCHVSKRVALPQNVAKFARQANVILTAPTGSNSRVKCQGHKS